MLSEEYHAEDGFELERLPVGSRRDLRRAGDSTADEGSGRGAQFRRSSLSSQASAQNFELYTPDEENAVIRKLDWNVVSFMSFLYLLSFLDRSSWSFLLLFVLLKMTRLSRVVSSL